MHFCNHNDDNHRKKFDNPYCACNIVGVCRNSFFWNIFAIWRFLRFQILSRFVPDLEFTDIFPKFWSGGRPTKLFPDRFEINFQIFVTPAGIDSYVQRSEFGFVCQVSPGVTAQAKRSVAFISSISSLSLGHNIISNIKHIASFVANPSTTL